MQKEKELQTGVRILPCAKANIIQGVSNTTCPDSHDGVRLSISVRSPQLQWQAQVIWNCVQSTDEEADSLRCLVSQMMSCLSSPTEPKMCEWWLCHATSCSARITVSASWVQGTTFVEVPFQVTCVHFMGDLPLSAGQMPILLSQPLPDPLPALVQNLPNACAHM